MTAISAVNDRKYLPSLKRPVTSFNAPVHATKSQLLPTDEAYFFVFARCSYPQRAENKILQQYFREVTCIRKMAPISLIVYHPKTAAGKEELARRVSEVHAEAVICRLKALNCPTQQKLELLDAVIETVRNNSLARVSQSPAAHSR